MSMNGNDPHHDFGSRTLTMLAIFFLALWLLVAFLPVISLFLPAILSQKTYESFKDVLQQWGQFGDMFNSLNVIFTAAALMGVIYTAVLQRHQITMQLNELANSAKQLGMAAEELKLAKEEREAARQAQAEIKQHLFCNFPRRCQSVSIFR